MDREKISSTDYTFNFININDTNSGLGGILQNGILPQTGDLLYLLIGILLACIITSFIFLIVKKPACFTNTLAGVSKLISNKITRKKLLISTISLGLIFTCSFMWTNNVNKAYAETLSGERPTQQTIDIYVDKSNNTATSTEINITVPDDSESNKYIIFSTLINEETSTIYNTDWYIKNNDIIIYEGPLIDCNFTYLISGYNTSFIIGNNNISSWNDNFDNQLSSFTLKISNKISDEPTDLKNLYYSFDISQFEINEDDIFQAWLKEHNYYLNGNRCTFYKEDVYQRSIDEIINEFNAVLDNNYISQKDKNIKFNGWYIYNENSFEFSAHNKFLTSYENDAIFKPKFMNIKQVTCRISVSTNFCKIDNEKINNALSNGWNVSFGGSEYLINFTKRIEGSQNIKDLQKELTTYISFDPNSRLIWSPSYNDSFTISECSEYDEAAAALIEQYGLDPYSFSLYSFSQYVTILPSFVTADGYVYDEFNKPVSNAKVCLNNSNIDNIVNGEFALWTPTQTVATDVNGHYTISVPKNMYCTIQTSAEINNTTYVGTSHEVNTEKSISLPKSIIKSSSQIIIDDDECGILKYKLNVDNDIFTSYLEKEGCVINSYAGKKGKLEPISDLFEFTKDIVVDMPAAGETKTIKITLDDIKEKDKTAIIKGKLTLNNKPMVDFNVSFAGDSATNLTDSKGEFTLNTYINIESRLIICSNSNNDKYMTGYTIKTKDGLNEIEVIDPILYYKDESGEEGQSGEAAEESEAEAEEAAEEAEPATPAEPAAEAAAIAEVEKTEINGSSTQKDNQTKAEQSQTANGQQQTNQNSGNTIPIQTPCQTSNSISNLSHSIDGLTLSLSCT